ncbi:unnamed protein product [Brassica rapa subsp. trilocularis]
MNRSIRLQQNSTLGLRSLSSSTQKSPENSTLNSHTTQRKSLSHYLENCLSHELRGMDYYYMGKRSSL